MMFAIKTEIHDLRPRTFAFDARKTMDDEKHIAKGDTIFLFASEANGGQGLITRVIVVNTEVNSRKPGVERQSPRVGVTIRCTAFTKQQRGRREH